MSDEQSKKSAAIKAVDFVKEGTLVGLGTGSTVKYAIEELARRKLDVTCIPSSIATEKLAKSLKLRLTTLNEHPHLNLYIDCADEVDKKFNLIKGGGGALTREKILASASLEITVVVDETKMVDKIGTFPLPIEVLPFAQVYVEKELEEIGGISELRKDFITDNGNIILDVKGLNFSDPLSLEGELNNIPGVVENGIFSMRIPNSVIVGRGKNVDILGEIKE